MASWAGGCERSVLHFNVADFAVCVERAEDRSLAEWPVIVAPLQSARAVVYDMSEEAYREGVRKGMGLKEATRRCRGARLLPPRPGLYRRAMAAFFGELRGYSPLIEQGRDDGHFFIDVTGTHRLYGPAPDVGWRVRRTVRQRFGINPIWTLGTSKLVSKVASRLVKPVGEYIVTPGDEASFLAPLPIEILPGLSPRELLVLREYQLGTVGAVASLSRQQLLVPFGRRGEVVHALSQGVDDSPVQPPASGLPAVTLEHDFAEDTNDRAQLEGVLVALAVQAGGELRRLGRLTRRVGLYLQYSDGGQVARQATCRQGTAQDQELRQLAREALQRAWRRRTRVRGCRLVCDRLQRPSPQLSLFPELAEAGRGREFRVQGAMDRVRSRYGEGVLGPATRASLETAAGACLAVAVSH